MKFFFDEAQVRVVLNMADLLPTGRAAQGLLVVAAWSDIENPSKFAVVGRLARRILWWAILPP
jgi:hypothetical protein